MEEQLEEMLTKCRLEKEQSLLQQASTNGVITVTTNNCTANAVAFIPFLIVEIEGVSITVLLDTISKCTLSLAAYCMISEPRKAIT